MGILVILVIYLVLYWWSLGWAFIDERYDLGNFGKCELPRTHIPYLNLHFVKVSLNDLLLLEYYTYVCIHEISFLGNWFDNKSKTLMFIRNCFEHPTCA